MKVLGYGLKMFLIVNFTPLLQRNIINNIITQINVLIIVKCFTGRSVVTKLCRNHYTITGTERQLVGSMVHL